MFTLGIGIVFDGEEWKKLGFNFLFYHLIFIPGLQPMLPSLVFYIQMILCL